MGASVSTVAESLTQQFHKLDKDKRRGYLVRACVLSRWSRVRASANRRSAPANAPPPRKNADDTRAHSTPTPSATDPTRRA